MQSKSNDTLNTFQNVSNVSNYLQTKRSLHENEIVQYL